MNNINKIIVDSRIESFGKENFLGAELGDILLWLHTDDLIFIKIWKLENNLNKEDVLIVQSKLTRNWYAIFKSDKAKSLYYMIK